MPLDRDQMREYQRRRRAKPTNEGSEDNAEIIRAVDNVTAGVVKVARKFKPFRAPNGNFVLKPPSRPYDETHVHNYRRRLGEDTATCSSCSEVARYEGRPLNIYNDRYPDWPQLIRDSPAADQIQRRMPVTQKRDQR